jgi:hypothetical protein
MHVRYAGRVDRNVRFNTLLSCTITLIAADVTNTKVVMYTKIYMLAAFHNWQLFVSPSCKPLWCWSIVIDQFVWN